MRKHLLGYLLGALDDSEHEAMRQQLEADPELRRQFERVRARVEPLNAVWWYDDPPAGLAARTCRYVAAEAAGAESAAAGRAACLSATVDVPPTGRWSLADLVVAAGIFLAASLLFFPAIASSRFQARVAACQNNLRQMGIALTQYSRDRGGYLPVVPLHGNSAVAGIYAPILTENGYVADARCFICPASWLAARRDGFRVPRLDELNGLEGLELVRVQEMMGGSYGYGLGYMDQGEYRANKNLGRSMFPIMADVSDPVAPGRRSANHGGRGQNVLLESGRVRYLVTLVVGERGDNPFLSDRGLVEPGAHHNDAVIAASATSPIPWTKQAASRPQGQE